MFEASQTAIDGVKLLRFVARQDERGYFAEVCSERSLAEAGIHDRFVADNQIFNRKANVVRGLHFQLPPYAQAKLVRVTRGRIYDVAVDLRPTSTTFGCHVGAILSAAGFDCLYLPEGFAHGFCTLEDEVEVQYKVSCLPASGFERGVLWNDLRLAIAWPLSGEPIIAQRDRSWPRWDELELVQA